MDMQWICNGCAKDVLRMCNGYAMDRNRCLVADAMLADRLTPIVGCQFSPNSLWRPKIVNFEDEINRRTPQLRK